MENGEVADDARIRACLPTIVYLLQRRPHASTKGVARHIPDVAGLLMEQEISRLTPGRPWTGPASRNA
ncbi:MAG: hypothetical protein ACQET7_12620 [Thermodesulfobacteriota bacterium]